MLSHVSPPFSKASYTTSRSLRCDGSNVSTSRPVMPKKAWSKSRASSSRRNPPRVLILPGRSWLEWWKPLVENRGSSNSRQPSRLFFRSFQSPGVSRMPSAHRHPWTRSVSDTLGAIRKKLYLTHANDSHGLNLSMESRLSRHYFGRKDVQVVETLVLCMDGSRWSWIVPNVVEQYVHLNPRQPWIPRITSLRYHPWRVEGDKWFWRSRIKGYGDVANMENGCNGTNPKVFKSG